MRAFVMITGVLTLLAGGTQAADEMPEHWRIAPDMKGNVEAYIENATELQDMRFYAVANDWVYANHKDSGQMMRVYDFLACLALTNDGADMDVDWGGGYDIDLSNVTFPGGAWDVQLRLRESHDKIDKDVIYVVDRLIVGTLNLRNHKTKMRAVRQLLQDCFNNQSS